MAAGGSPCPCGHPRAGSGPSGGARAAGPPASSL